MGRFLRSLAVPCVQCPFSVPFPGTLDRSRYFQRLSVIKSAVLSSLEL